MVCVDAVARPRVCQGNRSAHLAQHSWVGVKVMATLLRLFLVLVALVGGSYYCAPVSAQQIDCFNTQIPKGVTCSDQGEAKQAVEALLKAHLVDRAIICYWPESGKSISGYVTYTGPSPTCNGSAAYEAQRYWTDSCAARNSAKLADAKLWTSPPSTCIAGCKVQGDAFSSESGGVKFYGMRDRSYTGDSCSPQDFDSNAPLTQGESDRQREDGNKEKPQECTALGNGQTACQKPNGDHCATSSTGKTFCWQPNETGDKKDGPDAQTKSEKGKSVDPPPSVDPTKEYQRKEGHQQTACINNTCTTYNVTNFTETGKGNAKNSSGDNSPDGSGNTSGNGAPGKGSGGGQNEGEGDSATDSGNCQAPPMCTGDTLKCLHLRYTWKNQCNTSKDQIVGGDDCGAVPVCIGDGCKAQEYASLLQQWRGRCAAEDDRAKLAKDAAAGASDAAGDNEASAVADLWKKGPGQDGQGLDRGKLTLGGGELFPAIEIMGTAWAPPAQLYTVLDMIRQMVSAAGVLAAMYILFRK